MLDVEALAAGHIHRMMLDLVEDPLGVPVRLPVMVARGRRPGPVFGLTAAMHGNELNGIPTIHRLFQRLDADALSGTVVGAPVVNVPAYAARARTLREGMDLNRLMPGRPAGHVGEVYAYRLMDRLIRHFDYLVDLHTASFGRENALYVRADLDHEITRRMAHLQDPEIIVHNEAADGTLRGAAMSAGIPAITVEIGGPNRFQRALVKDSLTGIESVLVDLGLLPAHPLPEPTADLAEAQPPVVCRSSSWLYTQHGGLLEVLPDTTDLVQPGQVLARVRNMFGDVVAEYPSPHRGVVIGKSSHPVAETGSRIVHLGRPAPDGPSLSA